MDKDDKEEEYGYEYSASIEKWYGVESALEFFVEEE